jgi:hypothetical protein
MRRCPNCTDGRLPASFEPYHRCEHCSGTLCESCCHMARISGLLCHVRFNFSNEEELQLGIAELLAKGGYPFEREKRLDVHSRIDFYLPVGVRGIGIEAKVNGRPSEILRQVQRYAMHADVAGIIVLSRRANAHIIPDSLQDKPVRVISLWSSNL